MKTIIDPLGELSRGKRSSSLELNPIESVRAVRYLYGESDAIELCCRMANALIEVPPNIRNKFWTDSGRSLVASVIAHVATTSPKSERTLERVEDLLRNGDQANMDGETDPFSALYRAMRENRALGDFIPNATSPLWGHRQRLAETIRQTALNRL